MLLKNHIAYRFLLDDELTHEMLSMFFSDDQNRKLANLVGSIDIDDKDMYEMKLLHQYEFLNPKNQKAYLITDSVYNKLDLLKVKPNDGGHYDWTVFQKLTNCKKTFILPNNQLLRIRIIDEMFEFCFISFKLKDGSKTDGKIYWTMFFLDRFTGIRCDWFESNDVKSIEKTVYSLMCFIFLSDTEEIIVEPKRKYGTKKQGKVINELDIPLTIVNANWNITSIRTEGFSVSGHFAIRWTGQGRTNARLVWIDPFEKHGYIRKATKEESL